MRNLTVTILLLLSMRTYAGGETGGGFVIQCAGQPLMVLDYYEATLPDLVGKPHLLPLETERDIQIAKNTMRRRVSRTSRFSSFQGVILNKFQEILKTEDWVVTQLNIGSDDTNTPYKECQQKFRAAIRQSKTIYLEERVVPKLSNGQLFVLSWHEFLYGSSALESSEKVRHVIRELLKVDEEFSQQRLNELVAALLSRWRPVTIQTELDLKSVSNTEPMDNACRARGAEFATAYKGDSWTKPNCAGGCTSYRIYELTCAKLN